MQLSLPPQAPVVGVFSEPFFPRAVCCVYSECLGSEHGLELSNSLLIKLQFNDFETMFNIFSRQIILRGTINIK